MPVRSERYAARTDVVSSKSRDEIEHTIARFGATGFMYKWRNDKAAIEFLYNGLVIRFLMNLPQESDVVTPKGRRPKSVARAIEQETRRRWRSLALGVKAKLAMVSDGITSFEAEFAMHVVLRDGQTMSEVVLPRLHEIAASEGGTLLLPGGKA